MTIDLQKTKTRIISLIVECIKNVLKNQRIEGCNKEDSKPITRFCINHIWELSPNRRKFL